MPLNEAHLRVTVAASTTLAEVVRATFGHKRGKSYERVRRDIARYGIDTSHLVPSGHKLKPLDELLARRQETDRRVAARRRDTRAKAILADARGSDRSRGLIEQNDLTIEFIEESIAAGCSYCGDTTSMMTLDRIDNARGHAQANVVSACIRCNLIRRDMPYEAWLLIAPAVRRTLESGLFGQWTPRNSR